MERVENLTELMFFGQVGSSSLGSVIILYVILTVIEFDFFFFSEIRNSYCSLSLFCTYLFD